MDKSKGAKNGGSSNQMFDIKSIADLQAMYNRINSLPLNEIDDLLKIVKAELLTATNSNRVDTSHLEVLFRTYYKLLLLTNQTDDIFLNNFCDFKAETQPFIVYGLLHTGYHEMIELNRLIELCNHIIQKHCKWNIHSVLSSFRSVNLLYIKYPQTQIDYSLTCFYYSLQSQSSAIRDECLMFFRNWLKSSGKVHETFETIVNYWSWTSKYKHILLAVILTNHKIDNLLSNEAAIDNFLNGVRLSLKHKNLFSSGQMIIKSLCRKNSPVLTKFLLNILETGSHCELIYFHSQWMHYIRNSEELFQELGLDEPLGSILQFSYFKEDNFRFIIILVMFQNLMFKQPGFSALADYLQENCSSFDGNTQLYVYKFIVDSMQSTHENLSERLAFIVEFIERHQFVPCSDFRNTILNKLPLLFDLLAKKFKSCDQNAIFNFFRELRRIFRHGIAHSEYQPLIFSLKLFQLHLKCFQAETHKSLMKNSSLSSHQNLKKIMDEANVWQFEEEFVPIFDLLKDSGEFDDVRELIVETLIRMDSEFKGELELWKSMITESDIDRCILITYYARLCVNRNIIKSKLFYEICYEEMTSNLKELEKDSLKACKQGQHIFGLLNSVNEIFKSNAGSSDLEVCYEKRTLEFATKALQFVLKQLNLSGSDGTNASFQIIEESLEMLVLDSDWPSEVHATDRKFLLLSFWLTLKACCQLATTIGIIQARSMETVETLEILNQCLKIHVTVLHGCRHKGAIEAAGVCLGQLVKAISSKNPSDSSFYKSLYGCFSVLFGSVNNISTTRRGAGLSIMFHHFIKNDAQKGRPLFQHAIKILLQQTCDTKQKKNDQDSQQHDNFDALILHYLCVLVRDSELKESVSEYYDEIMMQSILRINDKEWTVRNGSLQLFGAIVPKIVGQKQSAALDEDSSEWEPAEFTFTEFCIKLPKTNTHILNYCKEGVEHNKSSIILFLEFLSNIDYVKKDEFDHFTDLLYEYRQLFWRFLSHETEKIRKLSSKCFARFHSFRYELPDLMLNTVSLLFEVIDENFIHGLLLFFIHAINKLKLESQYVSRETMDHHYEKVCNQLAKTYKSRKPLSPYVKIYLIDFLSLIQFNLHSKTAQNLIGLESLTTKVGSFNSTLCDKSNNFEFGIQILMEKLSDVVKIDYKV